MTDELARLPESGPTVPALPEVRLPATPAEDPVAVFLAGQVSENSRRAMRSSLDAIAWLVTGEEVGAGAIPWGRLGYAHTSAIRSRLAATYKPSTANRHLVALKGVMRVAWRLGYLSAEELARAIDLKPIPGSSLPAGRLVESAELSKLFGQFAAVEREQGVFEINVRDVALLSVLFGCGLRRSEAASLVVSDYTEATGRLIVTRAKGNKQREVWVPPTVRPYLTRWLEIRSREPGALFCAVPGGKPRPDWGLTDKTIGRVVTAAGMAAGLKPPITAHDARRLFVSVLLDSGVDLVTVQKLAGHASPVTTARYDRRGSRAMEAAAALAPAVPPPSPVTP